MSSTASTAERSILEAAARTPPLLSCSVVGGGSAVPYRWRFSWPTLPSWVPLGDFWKRKLNKVLKAKKITRQEALHECEQLMH